MKKHDSREALIIFLRQTEKVRKAQKEYYEEKLSVPKKDKLNAALEAAHKLDEMIVKINQAINDGQL
jgi:hypothetical protein